MKMGKLRVQLAPLHVRKLLLRTFFTQSDHLLPPHTPPPPSLHLPFSPSTSGIYNAHLFSFRPSSLRFFSSNINDTSSFINENQDTLHEENERITKDLSIELRKTSNAEPLPLPQRLDLLFSHIVISPALILDTLSISPDAGRSALDFLYWAKSKPDFKPTDEIYSYFVDYFGRRKDFKASSEVLMGGRENVGFKCLEALVNRLVRAGRPTQVVSLFGRMEEDYGFSRNMDSLKLIVSSLCDRGHANYAEKLVKTWADEFFPDEYICDALIEGWCIAGKLDDAKRLVDEMCRGGFEIGPNAYNAILDCVCRLCREKDTFRLQTEAESMLLEMERNGIPRNVETFNVLITNLCKIRKTEDTMKLFFRMGEWGCYPDQTTFLVLIKSLYQAARVGEGDEMIDRMKSAGYTLNKKSYYECLKILCGIERIDHAMTLFSKMKEETEPGIKTYDLLMGKLCSHGRLDKANVLYKEAERNGIPVEPKEYKVDPRFIKKTATEKKVKKRETLPEKMARKRRTLRKIRLSFVKKPKRAMRRAY